MGHYCILCATHTCIIPRYSSPSKALLSVLQALFFFFSLLHVGLVIYGFRSMKNQTYKMTFLNNVSI